MAQFRTSRTFDIVFLAAVVAFLGWATLNRVAIGDQVFFLTHQPSTEAVQVATQAGLSPAGRRLFYRTDPQFVDQTEVNAQCDVERLGCLSSRGQAFILDDHSKPNETIVTAAHEMLHLAYRRLSSARKQELAPLIDQAVALNSENGINGELTGISNPDDVRDEAHSLLGTEYRHLPPDLEHYYAQYFTDRSKVLAAEAASQL